MKKNPLFKTGLNCQNKNVHQHPQILECFPVFIKKKKGKVGRKKKSSSTDPLAWSGVSHLRWLHYLLFLCLLAVDLLLRLTSLHNFDPLELELFYRDFLLLFSLE